MDMEKAKGGRRGVEISKGVRTEEAQKNEKALVERIRYRK